MKRLLIITTSFPEKTDGSEAAGAFVADFAHELAQHADVTVVAPGLQDSITTSGRLNIRRFRVPSLPLSLLKPYNPMDWRPILQTLSAGQKAVNALTAEHEFDHIMALWALPSGYWARNGQRRIPYSIWALGSDIWTLGRIPLVRSILRKVLIDARLRFADGVALANDVTSICGRPCQFLPSSRLLSSESTVIRKANAPYKLVFLGRFHPNKGIDLLLRSLEMLNDRDWKFIAAVRIAGGGPLLADVESAVHQLKNKGRPVSLEGYKNREEAHELLTWGDIVLIPSRIESIPVIFSDAMQAGKPVIAMPVGDLPSLINKHQVGAVAEKIDASDYARLLTPDSLDKVADLASHTSHAAEEFNVTASARSFVQVLDSHD